MEAGLQHCEEQFLEVAVRHRLCRPTPHCVTLADVLRSHLEFPRSILPLDLDCDAVAAQLGQFAVHEEIRRESAERAQLRPWRGAGCLIGC